MSDIMLGECMCGLDASWYRTAPAPPPSERKGKSVGSIGLDNVDNNLCDGCYKGFTGSLDAETQGWKRVDTLQRQARAGQDTQDDRAPWDDGFGGAQSGGDDW
jgi:hypothetical protein